MTLFYDLWNVELKWLHFQWDVTKSQSGWHSKEGRPGGLRVPHHSAGTCGQVCDTCSLHLSYSSIIVSSMRIVMCFFCVFWSQRELLAVGNNIRVFVRPCSSTVQQVSCLCAPLAVRWAFPHDPSTHIPDLSIQKVRLTDHTCYWQKVRAHVSVK